MSVTYRSCAEMLLEEAGKSNRTEKADKGKIKTTTNFRENLNVEGTTIAIHSDAFKGTLA